MFAFLLEKLVGWCCLCCWWRWCGGAREMCVEIWCVRASLTRAVPALVCRSDAQRGHQVALFCQYILVINVACIDPGTSMVLSHSQQPSPFYPFSVGSHKPLLDTHSAYTRTAAKRRKYLLAYVKYVASRMQYSCTRKGLT
jgi:hypothetical protein